MSDTTNDKQATAPLLTRYSIYLDAPDTFVDMEHGEYVRWEDVQAKIASGELMAVKTAELWHPHVPEAEWRKWLHGSDPEFTMLVTKCCNRNPWTPPWLLSKAFIDKEGVFNRTSAGYVCPGCGAKITEV